MARSYGNPAPSFAEIDPLRWGWIVGLFEGEGWAGVSARDGRPRVQVQTTDEDVAQRLAEWSGVGTVTGPRPRRGVRKDVYVWRIARREAAGAFLVAALPYLSERRAETARRVIEAWQALPPMRGAETHCRGKGGPHELTPENTYVTSDGRRKCRACRTLRMREHRARTAVPTA